MSSSVLGLNAMAVDIIGPSSSVHVKPPLLIRLAAGDPCAAEEYHEAWNWLALRLSRRYVRPWLELEDLAQECHLALWKNCGRFYDGLCTEGAFVHRSYHCALTVVYRTSIATKRLCPTRPRPLSDQTMDPAPGPLDTAMRLNWRAAVAEVTRPLGGLEHQAIRLGIAGDRYTRKHEVGRARHRALLLLREVVSS